MSLPTFTLVAGDGLAARFGADREALAGATLTLKPNIKPDQMIVIDEGLELISEISVTLDDDGKINGDDGIELLADDESLALETPLQWHVKITNARARGFAKALRTWWFDAGADGETLSLTEAPPVAGQTVTGVTRGPRGYSTRAVPVDPEDPDTLYQWVDSGGTEIGDPVELVDIVTVGWGAVDWDGAGDDPAAEARQAIGTLGVPTDYLTDNSGDYMVNDVVRYTDPAPSPTTDLTGLYRCITDHTVGSPKDYPTRWELVSAPGVSLKAAPPRSRPTVRNRAKLARFETALATKPNPVITVVGNSVTWGVGSDGSGSTTTGFYEPYRQYAWPVLLRKLFAARNGVQPCENFIPLSTVYGYASNLANGAVVYQTVGPFGGMAGGGGISLPSNSATVDIAAARTGVFTELDVILFGTDAGATGKIPRVLIDDVEVLAGGGTSATNLTVVPITGLSEAAHKITLQGAGGSGNYVTGVVTRRGNGVVVNRIAVPGAKASDVIGAGLGWNTTQQNRQMDAATLAGYSDLVIIQFTANEVYQQVSLSSFQSDIEAIIARVTDAGGCVLLLGDPQVVDEDTAYAITGTQYRTVLKAISDANQYVAYADHAAIFGDRGTGSAMGLWPGESVHPTLEGHRRMADFVFRDVLPIPALGEAGSGVSRETFTTAEKRKLAASTAAATPSVLAQRDASGNLASDAFVPTSTSTATSGGTTTLTADSTEVQVFTGSSGQTVVLPTTDIIAGRRFMIVNKAAGSLVLQASDGSSLDAIPNWQSVVAVAVQDTPTTNSHWHVANGANYTYRTGVSVSSVAVRDSNANLLADSFIPSKAATATSAGTLTLTINSTQVQEFTGSTTHTVKLPTTSVIAGMSYAIINNSSGTVTVQSSGANTITTVAAGATVTFKAQVDTPTTAANWRYLAWS